MVNDKLLEIVCDGYEEETAEATQCCLEQSPRAMIGIIFRPAAQEHTACYGLLRHTLVKTVVPENRTNMPPPWSSISGVCSNTATEKRPG